MSSQQDVIIEQLSSLFRDSGNELNHDFLEGILGIYWTERLNPDNDGLLGSIWNAYCHLDGYNNTENVSSEVGHNLARAMLPYIELGKNRKRKEFRESLPWWNSSEQIPETVDRITYVLSYPDRDEWEPGQHILGFFSERNLAENQEQRLIQVGLDEICYDISDRNLAQIVTGANKVLRGEIMVADLMSLRTLDEHEYPWVSLYTSPQEILELMDKTTAVDKFIQGFEKYKSDRVTI